MGLAEFADRLIGHSLHPVPQRLAAVEGPLRVVVQGVHDLEQIGTGHDLRRHFALFGVDAFEFFETPGIGFVEVDLGAEEVPGIQCIGFATAGFVVSGGRQHLLAEEIGQSACGLASRLGVGVEIRAQGVRSCCRVRPGHGPVR